jgi:hypothetical protein
LAIPGAGAGAATASGTAGRGANRSKNLGIRSMTLSMPPVPLVDTNTPSLQPGIRISALSNPSQLPSCMSTRWPLMRRSMKPWA